MLNRLQYMQYSHYLIKTIHHESWYCKIMKNKMKILSYQKQWINDLYTIPFSDLKRPNIQWVVTLINYGNFGRKVTKSTVVSAEPLLTDTTVSSSTVYSIIQSLRPSIIRLSYNSQVLHMNIKSEVLLAYFLWITSQMLQTESRSLVHQIAAIIVLKRASLGGCSEPEVVSLNRME